MNSNNTKNLWLIIAIGLVGYILFFMLYPKYDDFSNIKFELREEQVEQITRELADQFNINLEGLVFDHSLRRNSDLLTYVQKKYGLKNATTLMQKNLPAYFWRAEYTLPRTEVDTSSSRDMTSTSGSDMRSGRRGRRSVLFNIATNGQILAIEKMIPPDTIGRELLDEPTTDNVKKILMQFSPEGVTDWQLSNLNLQERETSGRPRRLTQFRWISKQIDWADSLVAVFDFRQNELRRFDLSVEIPKIESRKFGGEQIFGILIGVVITFLSILMLIQLVVRLRQDKIDFKNSWIIAILIAVAMSFMIVPGMSDGPIYEMAAALFFAGLFLGIFAFLASSVAESLAREVWNEKLYSYDRLFQGKIYSHKLGRSLLNGLAFGGFLLGIFAVMISISDRIGDLWMNYEREMVTNFMFRFPFFLNIGEQLIKGIFVFIGILMFAFSFLRNKIKNDFLLALLTAAIFALLPMRIVEIKPFYFLSLINFILGFILIYVLIRFDFISVFVAFITALSFIAAIPYLNQSSLFYMTNGILTLIVPILFLFVGVIAIRSEEVHGDEKEYIPSYLKRLQERERFQRELEIARTVQLRFLPQSQPEVDWLDVASTCIPAYEVGGDYYDFLQLDDHRFGVVVGDVSGKGVSAAFYMTLMKGIFKSQTRHVQSPKEVLKQINDLFYENAQRGVFISMIYGVFDREKNTFVFSRAGHNPLITHYRQKNQAEELSPYGIAIGLDKGPVFDQSLQEAEMTMNAGDIFVFYTDGYSEAMNKDRDEFGEDRLIGVVRQNSHLSAKTILDKIQMAVDQFTGDTTQHDDMTMVIIRVNEGEWKKEN